MKALPHFEKSAPERERKQKRINVRASEAVKSMLQRAADIESHGDLSAFVLASAEDRAAAVLKSYEETELKAEDRERFYEFLLNPPAPSEALVALFAEAPTKTFRLVR